MKHLSTNNFPLTRLKSVAPCKNSLKLIKLKNLLQNSKKSKMFLSEKSIEKTDLSTKSHQFSPNLIVDFSKDLPLYLSIIEKPVNLLFSIDQFLFEFSKKTYQQKKTGEFSQQLRERKKLSLFYGHLTKKQLVNLFNKVKNNKGYFYKNVFSLLERRLDVVIYRTGFTKTITEARQFIKHKKILVNQNVVSFPSYLLNPGDIVAISPKTLNSLNIQLLNAVKTGSQKNHPKIFGDFYSRLKKIQPNFLQTLKTLEEKKSFDISIDNPKQLSGKVEKLGRNQNLLITQKKFQSKLLSSLLIQLLCTRIKLRCFWNLRNNAFDKFFGSSLCSNINKSNQKFLEKNVLILFKRKAFSNKGLKSRKTFYQKKSYRLKNDQQDLIYANKGCLQKKPLFWSRDLINVKQKKFKNQQKNLKVSLFKKKNLALYRKSFLLFLKYLENYKRFTNLLSLNLKKSLFKKSFYKSKSAFSKILTFRVIKPIHLEISYNLLNIIYLYSPQRVNFPFSIDLDLINRSLR